MTTQGAKKAWETRRARQAEEIRLQEELQKKRSDAALKAWATRRAQGWIHPNSR